MITTPLRFGAGVPGDVRADIRRGLPAGVTKYEPVDGPTTVVWVHHENGFQEVQLYQYLPEDPAHYRRFTGGDEHEARLLAKSMAEWNGGMRHLVEELGWSPEESRAEIKRINDEVFRLSLFAAATMVTSAAALASLVAGSKRSRGAAEEGGFAQGIASEEIAAIHEDLGGPGPLLSRPSSAVAAASRQNCFWSKCAAMVVEIAGRHMFCDANKRTAFAVVKELMIRNGIRSGVSDAEMGRVIMQVASDELTDIEQIAARLRGF